MTRLGEIGRRLRALWQRSRMASDLDDEMQLHMALRQERLQQASLPAETAAVAARQRFGDPLRLREDAMDAWGWRWLEQLGQDIRFALRSLARNPGFALTAICTLALGIGANTAVFSVVSGVVLRPLPFAEPERLMQISGTSPLSPAGATLGAEAVQNLDEYRRQARSFEAMAGSEVTARYVRRAEGPERVMTVRAEPDFFSILGVSPLRGRTFGPGDPPNVAVIGETFWTARLGGDPSVDRQLAHARRSAVHDRRRDAGVVPVSLPRRLAPDRRRGRGAHRSVDPARPAAPAAQPHRQRHWPAAPGVGVAAAQSELSAIARQLEAQYPDTNKDRGVRITPLSTAVVSPAVRRPLLVLFGAVGLAAAARLRQRGEPAAGAADAAAAARSRCGARSAQAGSGCCASS